MIMRKEVIYKGRKYPSIRALVREQSDLPHSLITSRLHRGWTLERALKEPKPYEVVRKTFKVDGTEYQSLADHRSGLLSSAGSQYPQSQQRLAICGLRDCRTESTSRLAPADAWSDGQHRLRPLRPYSSRAAQ